MDITGCGTAVLVCVAARPSVRSPSSQSHCCPIMPMSPSRQPPIPTILRLLVLLYPLSTQMHWQQSTLLLKQLRRRTGRPKMGSSPPGNNNTCTLAAAHCMFHATNMFQIVSRCILQEATAGAGTAAVCGKRVGGLPRRLHDEDRTVRYNETDPVELFQHYNQVRLLAQCAVGYPLAPAELIATARHSLTPVPCGSAGVISQGLRLGITKRYPHGGVRLSPSPT